MCPNEVILLDIEFGVVNHTLILERYTGNEPEAERPNVCQNWKGNRYYNYVCCNWWYLLAQKIYICFYTACVAYMYIHVVFRVLLKTLTGRKFNHWHKFTLQSIYSCRIFTASSSQIQLVLNVTQK